MNIGTLALLCALGALTSWYIARWYLLERARPRDPAALPGRPGITDGLIGFVTNFFDTLGIGSFAPTTAVFKLQHRPPDEQIPGTLNAGHALPTVTQALIFITAVTVDLTTLIGMIAAAVLGAWLGVSVVARLPRRTIQVGMGVALFVSALLFLSRNLGWMPGGGDALALHGGRLVFAISANFVLGALMMLGVGLYAPCLILVSLLGMNPLAAFPIMMGACAFLMPVGGARFIQANRYSLRSALGLALGGIPGVLAAAFIIKSLPIVWLRWLVTVVVLYAALLMLNSARTPGKHQHGQVEDSQPPPSAR
jgi:uncharacterized membrane protein YfcA